MQLVKRIINLKNKKFIRDSATLQVGSVFSTGLSFLASIIYARVLGVTGYANYALIFAFVSLFSVLMNVGTNQAALTLLSEAYAKKEKDKIKDLLAYYIKVTLAISLIVGAVIMLAAPFLTLRLYNNYEIGQLARIIILSNIIGVFFSMYIIVLQVIRKISQLTIMENINKIFSVLVPATLVLLGFGLKGLVWGYLAVAIAFMFLTFFIYRRLRADHPILPSWKEIFYHLKNVKINYYFKFGFLIAVDKNFGSLYDTLPVFILGVFNLEYVAFFKIASAFAGLPLLLISPISRLLMVQLPKSKSFSLKVLRRDFIKSSVGSFSITLAAAAVLMVLAPFLIPLVYGVKYLSAIGLSYPLLVGSIIVSFSVGIGPIFRTLHLMKKAIWLDLITLAVGGPALYYFIKFYPIQISIYFIAFWTPFVTLIFYVYLLSYLNKRLNQTGTS